MQSTHISPFSRQYTFNNRPWSVNVTVTWDRSSDIGGPKWHQVSCDRPWAQMWDKGCYKSSPSRSSRWSLTLPLWLVKPSCKLHFAVFTKFSRDERGRRQNRDWRVNLNNVEVRVQSCNSNGKNLSYSSVPEDTNSSRWRSSKKVKLERLPNIRSCSCSFVKVLCNFISQTCKGEPGLLKLPGVGKFF